MEDPELVFEPFPSDALARFVVDNVNSVVHAKTGRSDWTLSAIF